MKKIFVFAIALCILALAGCASQQHPDNPPKETTSIQSDSSESPDTQASTETTADITDPIETSEPDPFAEYGLSDEMIDAYWKEYFYYYSIQQYAELCNTMSDATLFSEHNLSDEWIETYWKKFALYYSTEQYVELCKIMTEMSAEPEYAVNSSLFLVSQDLSTYNTINQKSFLLNSAGEIIREYEDTVESEYAIFVPSSYQIGDYFLISTNNNDEKDVFADSGEFIGTYAVMDGTVEVTYDLGDGYYIFVPIRKGYYHLQIIHPTGEIYYVHAGRDKPNYESLKNGAMVIGDLSDGMFAVLFEYVLDTHAYYFDIYGEAVIDLSEEIVSFEVCEMGEFVDGQATISFVGVNDKNYSGKIDNHGSFVSDPQVIPCIACKNASTELFINPFSLDVEYYCKSHFDEIINLTAKIETNIADSSLNTHLCTVCDAKAVYRYDSFTGQMEYYCTTHYEELMEMFATLGLS